MELIARIDPDLYQRLIEQAWNLAVLQNSSSFSN